MVPGIKFQKPTMSPTGDMLPHMDQRQMFFALHLHTPVKRSSSRRSHDYLVLLLGIEEEISIELPFSEQELKEKYDGKLEKEIAGPIYEVMGKVMKVLINRKITGPGNFMGHSGTPAISCSFNNTDCYMYPLEHEFIYIGKPPIQIGFQKIDSVNFAKGDKWPHNFDFKIKLKNGIEHTFGSIKRREFLNLLDFITQKKLLVSYENVVFGDTDNENEPDACLKTAEPPKKKRKMDNTDEKSVSKKSKKAADSDAYSSSDEEVLDEEILAFTTPFSFSQFNLTDDRPNPCSSSIFEAHQQLTWMYLLEFVCEEHLLKCNCSVCKTRIYSSNALITHWGKCHRNLLLEICPICKERINEICPYPSAEKMYSHIKLHSEDERKNKLNKLRKILKPKFYTEMLTIPPKPPEKKQQCGICNIEFRSAAAFRSDNACRKAYVASTKYCSNVAIPEEEKKKLTTSAATANTKKKLKRK